MEMLSHVYHWKDSVNGVPRKGQRCTMITERQGLANDLVLVRFENGAEAVINRRSIRRCPPKVGEGKASAA